MPTMPPSPTSPASSYYTALQSPTDTYDEAELEPESEPASERMPLLYPSSSPSPFCRCAAHPLPHPTHAIESAWRKLPDVLPVNSLLRYDDIFREEGEELVRLCFEHNSGPPKPAPTPALSTTSSSTPSSSDSSLPPVPLVFSPFIPEHSRKSSATSFSSSSSQSQTSMYEVVQEIYYRAYDSEPSLTFTQNIDRAIKSFSHISSSTVRSALRSVTMHSFEQMWKHVRTNQSIPAILV